MSRCAVSGTVVDPAEPITSDTPNAFLAEFIVSGVAEFVNDSLAIGDPEAWATYPYEPDGGERVEAVAVNADKETELPSIGIVVPEQL
jgi:hypothetical protein